MLWVQGFCEKKSQDRNSPFITTNYECWCDSWFLKSVMSCLVRPFARSIMNSMKRRGVIQKMRAIWPGWVSRTHIACLDVDQSKTLNHSLWERLLYSRRFLSPTFTGISSLCGPWGGSVLPPGDYTTLGAQALLELLFTFPARNV